MILSPACICIVALIGALTWLAAVGIQVLDVVSSVFDARGARHRRPATQQERARYQELVWGVPLGAAVAALVVFGVDYSARLVFDQGSPRIGTLVLAASIATAFAAGLVIVARRLAPEASSYASIRNDIEDALEQRLTDADIDEFRRAVVAVDKRVGFLRTYPTLSPAAFLWHRTQLRLVPVLVPLLFGAYVLLAAKLPANSMGVLFIGALAPAAISYALAWAGARASLVSKRAWHEVYAAQRAEVEALLAGARKSSKKRVAGLGDRVTRALQILREQQN
ncbi:MAG: hypothetical protein EPN91_03500 [Salinibacterium sp.]|nr:MAG: hypothetical protein EPN91_03500 [Salinibacterium sp.]